MVRTGIGLYGFGNDPKFDKKLKPIASLKSIISQINELKPGDTLGYNRAFTAQKPTRTEQYRRRKTGKHAKLVQNIKF